MNIIVIAKHGMDIFVKLILLRFHIQESTFYNNYYYFRSFFT